MLAMMACNTTDQKKEGATDQTVIGAPEVKIENGQMTPEVLWAFGRVGNVSVSPDGKQIAYTVTYYSIPENRGNADLYVMDADGTNKKQLTRTASGTSPRTVAPRNRCPTSSNRSKASSMPQRAIRSCS